MYVNNILTRFNITGAVGIVHSIILFDQIVGGGTNIIIVIECLSKWLPEIFGQVYCFIFGTYR